MKEYKDFNDLHCALGLDAVKLRLRKLQDEIEKKDTASNSVPKIEDPHANKDISMITNSEEKAITKEQILGMFPWNATDPIKNFNIKAFPEILQKYITNLCSGCPANELIIISSLLTTLSALMGGKIVHERSANDYVYATIWIVIISPSANFKSTGLKRGSLLARKWHAYVNEKITYYSQQLQSPHLSEGMGKDAEDSIKKWTRKKINQPCYGSAVSFFEALSKKDVGLVLASEYAGYMENLGKKYNSEGPKLMNQAFDVDDPISYSTGKRGDIDIEKPYLSLCGVTPIDWYKSNFRMEDSNCGFIARNNFLLIPKPKGRKKYTVRATEDFNKELQDSIFEQIKDLHDEETIVYTKDLCEEGLIDNIYDLILDRIEEFEFAETLEPYALRWTTSILKIAMIMEHFFDKTSKKLSTKSIMAAYSFVKHTIDSTIKLFGEHLLESDFNKKLKDLLAFIVKRHAETNQPVPPRDIKNYKGYLFDNSYDEIEKYLKTLEITELIAREAGQRASNGKPVMYCTPYPKDK